MISHRKAHIQIVESERMLILGKSVLDDIDRDFLHTQSHDHGCSDVIPSISHICLSSANVVFRIISQQNCPVSPAPS